MTIAPLAPLEQALQTLFPGQQFAFVALSEEPSSSRTYAVRVTPDTQVFVKGTPRSHPEAVTTAHLFAAYSDLVPAVLQHDLLPEAEWRWFVMADAGDCSRLELTLEHAHQAAFALGTLQRAVQGDTVLQALLPACLPGQLYESTRSVCGFLEQEGDPGVRLQAQMIGDELQRLEPVFQSLAQCLTLLPPTCVHGDFWPGNIAIHERHVRIIDWGEAVWGIGGVSIWNLLYTSQTTLSAEAPTIWEAYSQGWQTPIGQEYITAAQLAFFVTMLVVDQQAGTAEDVEEVSGTLSTLANVINCLRQAQQTWL